MKKKIKDMLIEWKHLNERGMCAGVIADEILSLFPSLDNLEVVIIEPHPSLYYAVNPKETNPDGSSKQAWGSTKKEAIGAYVIKYGILRVKGE